MVDEIKKAEGDSLPGKGQTSKGETETTSQKTPDTFEQEKAKAVSDALATAGRTAKELEAQREEVNRLLASAKKLQDDQAERDAETRRAEFDRRKEANRDDVAELKRIDREEKAADREAKLAKRERELDERDAKTKPQLDELAKSTKERNAREIATKHNVAVEDLVEFTDGSQKAMEALATKLSKTEESTLDPDSGKTIGSGGGIPTNMEKFRQWVADMPQDEYEKRKPEIDKALEEGKIK